MRIVVADDSRVMRQIVVRTLRQAGFDWEVMEAEDGAQALQLALNENPDLVLSDIEMLQQLRATGSKIPVGFVTSEGSPQMRQIAQEAGANFLIAKPFDAATFKEILGAFNR